MRTLPIFRWNLDFAVRVAFSKPAYDDKKVTGRPRQLRLISYMKIDNLFVLDVQHKLP